MCGIVGYVGKRSAQDVLLDGLEKLEYRGYDSAGVALALDGGIRVVKSKGRLTQLRQKLAAQALAQSFCGIGHTRWATHGEPSDVNSHPHSTPRVSIVHNGIIENYGILKERLIAKGYTFESETDTEVLVKLIDSCYTGDPLRALQEALAKVRGSYALAVLFRDRPDTIFAVKRESPLIVGWGEGENFVASDIPALLKYTRRYSVLEEGDMAVCTAEGIRFYNEFAEPVQRPVLTADWDNEVVFAQSEVPVITGDILNSLRTTGKTLCVVGDGYTLQVSGKDVRNTTGELNTSLELQQVEQGLEFVVNDGKTVPCSARIDLDKSDYSRLYLYNETTGKWQYLNSYKDGVITLDTAGRYLLTNENLRFANINWTFFIAGGAVLVVIAVAYIAFKKRYWFW